MNYGLDAELARKQAAKYDVELEKEVTDWIEAVSGEKKGDQEVEDWLRDGTVLCKLANTIVPGTIKKVNTSKMPFKQMENITFFMNAARALGVSEIAMFGTPDLYEGKNLGSVLNCINTYGGVVQVAVPDFKGPHLGVPVNVESRDKKRDGAMTYDQSQGLSGKMQIERPSDGVIVRGQAADWQRSPSKDGAKTSTSTTPEAKTTTSPRPAAGYSSGSPSPDKAPVVSPPKPIPEGDDYNYGLDADLKRKQDAKYDVGLEREVVDWIEAITGEKQGEESLHDWLKDGRVLCELANKVKPGCVAKLNTSKLAFKQMENITFFMNAARDMGVPEMAMFGTPDLYEDKNMGSVVSCIYSYGGAVQVALPSFAGPKLGIPLNVDSKDKKREGGAFVDQSAGYSTKMEVVRPTERADYCVKPIDRS